MNQDVVVTGVDVIAPNGAGLDAYWEATLKGVSAIRPIGRFDAEGYPVRLAAEIPEFDAEFTFPKKLTPQTDRLTRLALICAEGALSDAGVDPAELPEYAVGVAVSSSTGGLEFGQQQLQQLWGSGWESVSPYMSFAWYYAVNTGQISIRSGMRGPGGVVVSEQAGGLDSMAFARRRVRKGTQVMTTGGFDSLLCPYGISTVAAAPGVSGSADPDRAYLPFRADSTGFVPGEGGAVLVLEPRTVAEERGAETVYGVVAGHGAAFDPDVTGSGGDGLLRAARAALADAGLTPDNVDVVFADASGSVPLDRAEAAAIERLFGARRVPVSAPKSLVGRLISGGSALDVVTALLSLRDGVVPAVPGTVRDLVDPRIDLVVGEPRTASLRCALVLARGHGGFASAMVLTAP
ncbi:beta-ketoacyl synthase N-terminal-like domain-containing protein [Streptomyces sp. MBT60]|uniref:beta-ketoacyl synthase N-terminal-like domain-containing protein n=1 Tax=Streptomyces sp. MBT60 TaxID=2800409 RepID=UPI00190B30AA|nr:beta-ketoacyl synthase N-terminal-like domain-containing protein [Streptomyces sp. MBT60]MBK3542077.1 ketosynthase chain-length factor [Streptomyces sp. MBT60]